MPAKTAQAGLHSNEAVAARFFKVRSRFFFTFLGDEDALLVDEIRTR
jgi:hypothetical protein